jgi:hypothetical protein
MNPIDFIELMVIANRIPDERKRRLSDWGVSFKEIPLEDFADLVSCTSITAVPEWAIATGGNLKTLQFLQSLEECHIDNPLSKWWQFWKE